MTDTHALLVALLATHRPLFRTRRPDEVGAGATGPLATCSCGDWTEHPDPTRSRTHAHHLADVLLEHGVRVGPDHEPTFEPTFAELAELTPTPPAKYGRCPWCHQPVDSVELLEAGPYLTPCWHLVAVIAPATGLDGWRLERAAPAERPGRS